MNGATAKIIWGLILHGTDVLVIWIPFLLLITVFVLLRR
jgi:hypothetical protein